MFPSSKRLRKILGLQVTLRKFEERYHYERDCFVIYGGQMTNGSYVYSTILY